MNLGKLSGSLLQKQNNLFQSFANIASKKTFASQKNGETVGYAWKHRGGRMPFWLSRSTSWLLMGVFIIAVYWIPTQYKKQNILASGNPFLDSYVGRKYFNIKYEEVDEYKKYKILYFEKAPWQKRE